MLGTTALVLLGTLLVLLYAFFRQRYTFWRRRKVPGPTPIMPFGNTMATFLGRRAFYDDYAAIYRQYMHEPYVGIYVAHTPILQLHDLEIIKAVMVKDFQDYNGRGFYSNPEADPLSGHLFVMSGKPWRDLRVKLTPMLSSGKIKYFFNRVQESANNMQLHVGRRAAAGGGSYKEDVRELTACYGTDIIASVIFGMESNCLEHPDSEIRLVGKKIFEPSFAQYMRFNMRFFGKEVMSTFGIRLQPATVNDFFHRVVKETVEYREKNGVERADLMNLLIQLKNKGFFHVDNASENTQPSTEPGNLQKLTLNQMIGQVFVFFIGGYETASTTASFALYQIAKHPEVLKKLTEEIDTVLEKYNGTMTYDAINELPYMDKVINESMRLVPPFQFLTREAMTERTLPNTDLLLPKGMQFIIPVNAIHRNPEIWPDPDKFDPERFSEENKASIPQMAYLPFGAGPRICLGLRFGLVQAKAALTALLSQFNVSRCAETPEVVEIDPYSNVPAPVKALLIKVTEREKKSST